ncbi:MAG: mechanosensitive ion channel family protein [Thermoproteota archaeon]
MDQLPFLDMDPYNVLLKTVEIAAVVVAIFLFTRVVSRIIEEIQERRNLERRIGRQINIFFKYLVYGVGFLVILSLLGVDVTVIATSLGVMGIAVGFVAKDIMANFLSGIFLIFEKAYQVNDVVKINDVYGIVRLMKLRTTPIKTFDGNIVTLSNSKIASSTIINMTSGSEKMQTSISVKLGYKENFEEVKRLMKETASQVEGVYIDEDYDVRFEVSEIGKRYHGLRLTMYFYVDPHREPWIKSGVLERINRILVESGVEFHREAPR